VSECRRKDGGEEEAEGGRKATLTPRFLSPYYSRTERRAWGGDGYG